MSRDVSLFQCSTFGIMFVALIVAISVTQEVSKKLLKYLLIYQTIALIVGFLLVGSSPSSRIGEFLSALVFVSVPMLSPSALFLSYKLKRFLIPEVVLLAVWISLVSLLRGYFSMIAPW